MKTRALTENELGMLCEICDTNHAHLVAVEACTAFCSKCFRDQETWEREYFADCKRREAIAWGAEEVL